MTVGTPAIERDEVVSLTADLAAINSINSTLVDGAPGEGKIGAFVEEWMRGRGWDVHVEWPAPGRPNVIGVIHGGPGPRLMINAHLDTVGANAQTLEVRVGDDRIHGRGVLDTKGGLAAALIAAAALGADGPPGDVIIAAVSDEEADSVGTAHLLQEWAPDAAIVIEPTDLSVVTAHRGFGVLEVIVRGRSAHTGHRLDGRNAIDAAVRLANELGAVDARFAARTAHPMLAPADVQITSIDGGTEMFTVPDRCAVVVEVRTLPGTHRSDLDAVVACLDDGHTPEVTYEHRWLLEREPFEIDVDAHIARTLGDAVTNLGHDAAFTAAPFWTDAALFAAHGIPSVVFGPGGHGIHSDDEWVAIDDLVACNATLHRAMTHFGARR